MNLDSPLSSAPFPVVEIDSDVSQRVEHFGDVGSAVSSFDVVVPAESAGLDAVPSPAARLILLAKETRKFLERGH